MARPPNYGFEKRRKEQERKAKKDARREERRLRKAQGGEEGEAVLEGETDASAPAESDVEPTADDAP